MQPQHWYNSIRFWGLVGALVVASAPVFTAYVNSLPPDKAAFGVMVISLASLVGNWVKHQGEDTGNNNDAAR